MHSNLPNQLEGDLPLRVLLDRGETFEMAGCSISPTLRTACLLADTPDVGGSSQVRR